MLLPRRGMLAMLLVLRKLMLPGWRGGKGACGAVPVPIGTLAILLTARWSQEPLADAMRETSGRSVYVLLLSIAT